MKPIILDSITDSNKKNVGTSFFGKNVAHKKHTACKSPWSTTAAIMKSPESRVSQWSKGEHLAELTMDDEYGPMDNGYSLGGSASKKKSDSKVIPLEQRKLFAITEKNKAMFRILNSYSPGESKVKSKIGFKVIKTSMKDIRQERKDLREYSQLSDAKNNTFSNLEVKHHPVRNIKFNLSSHTTKLSLGKSQGIDFSQL